MQNILIILLLAVFGLGVSAQTTVESAAQAQNTKAVVSPISEEEYKVYHEVLEKEKGMLVIRIETSMDEDSKNVKLLEQRGFTFFLKQLESETLRDFLAKNEKSEMLEKKFSRDLNYTLVSTADLKQKFAYQSNGRMDWESFRGKYPKAENLYTVSRIGFSRDGTQALVFVTNWCNSLCGEGNYYVLKKENSEWRIVDKLMTWIS
jgi:hypothetical protein